MEVKVAIGDAVAEVQSVDKPDCIKNCSQLVGHFINRVMQKYSDSDEVRFIFDRYEDEDEDEDGDSCEKDKGDSSQSPITSQIPES